MIQGRVSLTVAPLDMRPVVDAAVDTIRPAATAKDITINVDPPDEPITVIGDDHRLQQMVVEPARQRREIHAERRSCRCGAPAASAAAPRFA